MRNGVGMIAVLVGESPRQGSERTGVRVATWQLGIGLYHAVNGRPSRPYLYAAGVGLLPRGTLGYTGVQVWRPERMARCRRMSGRRLTSYSVHA